MQVPGAGHVAGGRPGSCSSIHARRRPLRTASPTRRMFLRNHCRSEGETGVLPRKAEVDQGVSHAAVGRAQTLMNLPEISGPLSTRPVRAAPMSPIST
jgi:hypothetical protein